MLHAKLTFIADLHYYSPTLGTTGKAYNIRSGSDQKCLGETSAIIDSAFQKIAESDCDAVLILGDITNNGERKSHEELREKLYALKKNKPVYLLTATHDWCSDGRNNRYEGENVISDVDVMAPDELYNFYYDYTLKDCLSFYKTHIGTYSYTKDIGNRVRILCLNDDKNENGHAGFSPEHLEWIKAEIKKANAEGKILIGMEHHLIMDHIHPILTFGSVCVEKKESLCTVLADSGLKYMFVGHSHMQGIECFKTENGNKIYQINVGSLVGYPSPIVNVEVFDEHIRVSTTHAEKLTYLGKEYDLLSYVRNHTLGLIENILNAINGSKEDFCSAVSGLGISQEKVGSIYAFAHPFIRHIKNTTVGDGFKKLWFFGLTNSMDKNTIMKFKDKKIIDFVYEIFLSLFDGSKNRHDKNSDYCKAVMEFMSLIVRLKDVSATRSLKELVCNIITGNEWDINDCELR